MSQKPKSGNMNKQESNVTTTTVESVNLELVGLHCEKKTQVVYGQGAATANQEFKTTNFSTQFAEDIEQRHRAMMNDLNASFSNPFFRK